MPIYTLGKKTYNIFPVSPTEEKEPPTLDNKKLCHVANFLSEFFGCFIVMGMSTNGDPQIIIAASSDMEHLALKQFAQDMLMEDSDIIFTKISDEYGEDEDLDEEY